MKRINNMSVLENGQDVERAIYQAHQSQMALLADLIGEKYPVCEECGKRIVAGDKELGLCSVCIKKSDEAVSKAEDLAVEELMSK